MEIKNIIRSKEVLMNDRYIIDHFRELKIYRLYKYVYGSLVRILCIYAQIFLFLLFMLVIRNSVTQVSNMHTIDMVGSDPLSHFNFLRTGQ